MIKKTEFNELQSRKKNIPFWFKFLVIACLVLFIPILFTSGSLELSILSLLIGIFGGLFIIIITIYNKTKNRKIKRIQSSIIDIEDKTNWLESKRKDIKIKIENYIPTNNINYTIGDGNISIGDKNNIPNSFNK